MFSCSGISVNKVPIAENIGRKGGSPFLVSLYTFPNQYKIHGLDPSSLINPQNVVVIIASVLRRFPECLFCKTDYKFPQVFLWLNALFVLNFLFKMFSLLKNTESPSSLLLFPLSFISTCICQCPQSAYMDVITSA